MAKIKLTKEKIEEICKHIANGNFFEQSCELSNVPKSTAYGWLERAAKETERNPIFSEFSDAKKKAEAEFERKHLANINLKSKDDWKASAWALERKYPERWGKQRIEITGKDGNPIEHKFGSIEDFNKESEKRLKETEKAVKKRNE